MKHIYSNSTLLILGLLFLSACTGSEIRLPATASSTPTLTATMVDQGITETPVDGGLTDLGDAVPTRTPEPTATPGPLARGVSELVEQSNLTGDTLIWLKVEDWINLGISIYLFLLAT